MSILQIEHCTICYQNGTAAVSDVSLSIEQGEIVSIVGESGSGKTTLIRAILGLLPPGGRITEGRILFDGRDLSKATERQLEDIRGRDIAMIFQDVGASMDPIQRIGRQYRESIGGNGPAGDRGHSEGSAAGGEKADSHICISGAGHG